jgi:hypothetical protein
MWRFAWSMSSGQRVIDTLGRWVHVVGPLWYLTDTAAQLFTEPDRIDP